MIRITALFIILFLLTGCRKERISVNWIEQESNTDYLLSSVYFYDELEGYAVGGDSWYYGVILHTIDGGTTWQADSLSDKFHWGLQADQDQNLYTTGINGYLFDLAKDSTDWRFHRIPHWGIMRDVAFYDHQRGVLVGGEAFKSGYIVSMKADFKMDTLILTENDLNAVCFSDSTTVHTVGYGAVLRSLDTGKTWTKQVVPDDYYRSVCFPTSQTGYAVGATGAIIKSVDAGENWQVLRDGDDLLVKDIPFRSVFFVDAEKGYLVGDKGTFWRTLDGGSSWQIIRDLPKINFYDVFVVDNKGWIVGEGGRVFSFMD